MAILLGRVRSRSSLNLTELTSHSWPFIRNWTWTAQVCFTLHLLALFMKLHSYAFYNGHLNEAMKRLNELDHPEKLKVKRKPLVRYPSSSSHITDIRRDQEEIARFADPKAPIKSITEVREGLAMELTSPLGRVTYPENLTVVNYLDYLCCPTLCYELEVSNAVVTRWNGLIVTTLSIRGSRSFDHWNCSTRHLQSLAVYSF